MARILDTRSESRSGPKNLTGRANFALTPMKPAGLNERISRARRGELRWASISYHATEHETNEIVVGELESLISRSIFSKCLFSKTLFRLSLARLPSQESLQQVSRDACVTSRVRAQSAQPVWGSFVIKARWDKCLSMFKLGKRYVTRWVV